MNNRDPWGTQDPGPSNAGDPTNPSGPFTPVTPPPPDPGSGYTTYNPFDRETGWKFGDDGSFSLHLNYQPDQNGGWGQNFQLKFPGGMCLQLDPSLTNPQFGWNFGSGPFSFNIQGGPGGGQFEADWNVNSNVTAGFQSSVDSSGNWNVGVGVGGRF